MTGRIYIRDFSYEATAEDLGLLISKVCPVDEVYISGKTPTGINRSFAIVVVKANDALIEKCIKTFNNCHWKGTKIWVEKAKEYYKDRFERERARERKLGIKKLHSAESNDEDLDLDKLEELLTEEIKAADSELDTELDPNSEKIAEGKIIADSAKITTSAAASVKHVIRIKKCRDGAPITISMIPSLSSSTSGNSMNNLVP
jgi:RNA recognition motif-containing protein